MSKKKKFDKKIDVARIAVAVFNFVVTLIDKLM